MMKRFHLMFLAAAVATTASAQTAIDVYSISQNDLRGTARFMSMAGAFGALGGDLSTLNQNPGGIGVYRSSEIGATLDIDCQGTTTTPNSAGPQTGYNQTKVACNNFGYVGTIHLSSDVMPFFNWGASYSRVASFNRAYQGSFDRIDGSLTNYVAGYTGNEKWDPATLSQFGSKDYNPYQDSMAPWMSILFFNNYLINPRGGGYSGLYNGTPGYGEFWTSERGYVDEYSINFGGNLANTVYWGIGFGITDMSFTQETYYEENFSSATVPNKEGDYVTSGSGGYGLNTWKHIYGTGFNFKAGVIFKPVNEFRLGLAIHTPTWYSLTQEGWAAVDYDLSTGYYPTDDNKFATETDYGYLDRFIWKSRNPWRLILSGAGVVGGRFIISADYEFRPYQNMNIADGNGNDGNGNPESTYTMVNGDVKEYYRASNIVRLGGEFRITPQFSLRAGYSYESSPATTKVIDGATPVYTSGPDDTETTPSYTMDRATQYVTCGIGYRYKGFYVDAAYVHKHRESQYCAYTEVSSDNTRTGAPTAKVVDNNSQIVLSMGFKF